MAIQCTEEQDEIMYLVKEYYGLMSAANTIAVAGGPSSMADFQREQAGETWDKIKYRMEELVDCECERRMRKPLMVRGPPVPLAPHEAVDMVMAPLPPDLFSEKMESSHGIDLPPPPKLRRGFWGKPSQSDAYRNYSYYRNQNPGLFLGRKAKLPGIIGRKIHQECRGKTGAEFTSCRLNVVKNQNKKLSVLIAEAEAIFDE